MNISFPEGFEAWPEVRPFVLMRDHILPVLEEHRPRFEAMYDARWGRPEIDPVLLAAFTVLQMLQRLPDRAAVEHCTFDVRWRLALNLPPDWVDFHPTTLVHFRRRLADHGGARWALGAGLEAMRRTGYLKGRRAIRIDSTHVLGWVAAMSRLECVRETLRLALAFLAAFGGEAAWMPWMDRYAQRRPEDLRRASANRLRATMAQAGLDMHAVLERATALGPAVADAEPVALLRRVFHEQFETLADADPSVRRTTPPQAVHNPHDPDAAWSTKKTLSAGWVGYKAQVCETAEDVPRARREPTRAVITAVVTQPATASDQTSLPVVLAQHVEAGQPPADTVHADAGYINANQLEAAAEAGFELCGPVGAPPHSGARFGSDAFDVDLPNRRAVCPAGHVSTECSRIDESRGAICYYFAWARATCAACALAGQCLSKRKRSPFRTLQVGDRHMIVQARRRLCQTPAYRRRMHRRNGIEGSISELKRGHGIRRCRYRGRPRTDVQMQFAAASCNLRRWAARLAWLARQRA